jgi:hypothetical protein
MRGRIVSGAGVRNPAMTAHTGTGVTVPPNGYQAARHGYQAARRS